jgi:acetyl-CoA acyltransferase
MDLAIGAKQTWVMMDLLTKKGERGDHHESQAYICDAIRTPFGRYGGALSSVRTDDLGAIPIKALMARNPERGLGRRWTDVLYGCANQAGEDNRNVARMSQLLAGLPIGVPGATINRLCGSGLDAVGSAARAIKAGEAGLMIAGGVESMSRAPFVMPKAESAFSRTTRSTTPPSAGASSTS